MITLTRRYHFSASHRLHSDALDAAENARFYGKCNNPFGHGHDYALEVTVAGNADPVSGLIVPIAALDRFIEEKILRLFAHRNINLDVPQFARLVPTTENLAIVMAALLQEHWPGSFDQMGARPVRIHIQETGRNGFELLLGKRTHVSAHDRQKESVTVHV
ncbi:MAG TPA: 6-carboxytetrahydropterin synthase [Bryobacteraceae bacterium]|nr:6-carboxytetrahydropterin synthase [Bryobacteraceae bacterium]